MRFITAILAVCLCAGVATGQDDLDSLNTRVEELYGKGDYAGATKIAEQAVQVAERQFGKDALETATPINNLAALYRAQGKYAEAEPLQKRALAIREKALGPDHRDTATSLNNLAGLYKAQGKYAEAESLYKRAVLILEKSLGPDHPTTATSLNNLAGLYTAQGKYADAESLCKRALGIREKALGSDHPTTATSLNNLVELYRAQGKYAEAEPLQKRALAIREKAIGPDHPDTAKSVDNLAFSLFHQGKYAEAEPLHKRALAIFEKVLGPDHRDTATSVDNLAALYRAQGKYAEAEPLQKRALAIREKALGPDHRDTATSLNNLAGLYKAQGKHAEAESLQKRALAIREKVLGPDHRDTAASVNNLAGFYGDQGKYAEAESLYKRAVLILEKSLGPDHPNTATSLHNLAGLYTAQGKYAEAESLYKRALGIKEKALGSDHPTTAISLDNLAFLEETLGRFADAALLRDRARRGKRRHVSRVLPSLSATEQAAFLRKEDERSFHNALSLGLLQKSSPQIASLTAGWLANGKAVAQEALSQQILLVRQSDNAQTAALVASMGEVRSNIARLSQVIPAPDQVSTYRAKVESLQREQLRLISEIGGQLATLNREEPWVEIAAIRKGIPSGSVLVDIAQLYPYDFSAKGNEQKRIPPFYAAWIVPPDDAGDVTIVDLGDAAEIDSLVAEYRRSIEARRTEIPAAKPLAEKVLQPILASLPSGGGKVEELILSPDGALWLVPWQALPLEDGRYAIEKYTIRTVISGRSLVPPPPSAKPSGETTAPLVMADPDFDSPTPAEEANSSSGVTGRFLEPVEPLPNTKIEAEAARGPLGSLAGVEPVVKLGRNATETELKSLAVRPKVLVLATHGFFLPDQEIAPDDRLALGSSRMVSITRPVDKSGKAFVDPLLRCGLLLAGANVTLSGQQTGSDDGILTGAEIVGLDLLGTDLVVLSACETGVGDVRNGEGVAGLRQAFQIAGAATVVSTLWRVPDAESAAIMTDFYQHLAAGKSATVALREAQLGFIAASREKAVSPYLWAAYGVTGR